MRLSRFTSGLALGLVLGLPAGALVVRLVAPSQTADSSAVTSPEVELLTRKLEAANEDRQRKEEQIAQFQKLAEQMTASFNNLEQRFKALEEERVRAARLADQQGAATPTIPTPAAPSHGGAP
jgi:TolA-binding protein